MVATVLPCPVGITWPTKAKAYVNPNRQDRTDGEHEFTPTKAPPGPQPVYCAHL
jgi:hypothetical protein